MKFPLLVEVRWLDCRGDKGTLGADARHWFRLMPETGPRRADRRSQALISNLRVG